jgi:hypothetical protein
MMKRIIIALLCGIVAALGCYAKLTISHVGAGDFAWPLWGARLLLAGANPYDQTLLAPRLPYAPDAPLFYPLPALWLVAPLIALPDSIAAALFVGIGCTALAWSVTDTGYWRLLLFVSPAMYACVSNAQWTPLLTAAIFLPWLAPLAVVKPNLGAAIVAYRPSWRLLLGLAGMLALSVAALPTWPMDWLRNVQASPHTSPLMVLPFGPLLLIPLRWWKDERARLLLALSLFPNRMAFYDQLGLLTIPANRGVLLVCLACQWLAFYAMPGAWWDATAQPWIVALCYVPVLLCYCSSQLWTVKAASCEPLRESAAKNT